MALTTDLDAVSLGDAATAVFVLEPPRHVGLDATPLAAGKYLIGSADDCQIRLPVVGVQPHHALLIVGERKSLLKAWDEKTWINDWPVKESVLRAGDRISIGPVTLRWRAVRADEIPPTPPRRIDAAAPLVQELAAPATVHPAAPLEHLPPATLPQIAPPAPVISHDQQIRHERRLEELTQQLDARAAALQQEIDRQAREWRDRDAAWSDERRRAEDEFAARELNMLSRRQELETWELRLASHENELEGREAAWAAHITEIRSVWETMQRDGEVKIEKQLAALEAETAAYEQRQVELDELEQSLAERDLALAEAEREFEDRQSATAAALAVSPEVHHSADRDLDERNAELNVERQSLSEDQALFAKDRNELDAERREFMALLAAADERQRQLDELQARLRQEQYDLTAARREIQSDRSEIEEDRAAMATERVAMADEWESLATANVGNEASSLATSNDALIADQAAFAAERTAFLAERDEFETRKLAWQEEVEQQRLHAETTDRDLADRQHQIVEAQARLEEDRRELQLKRADLEDAERKLQAAITERDGELLEIHEKQSVLDERLAQWEIDQTELASARSELDAARDTWQLETATSRRELEARMLALSEAEANLAEREAELQTRVEALPVETIPATPAANAALPAEIERLTAELEREQEYRRTIESQLEGIRTRHERDAENWHSKRTDWMVERDRLERELQAATRQLSAQKSKQLCSDVAPVDLVPPHDVAPVDDMIADRYRDPVAVDPRWDSGHKDEVAADN